MDGRRKSFARAADTGRCFAGKSCRDGQENDQDVPKHIVLVPSVTSRNAGILSLTDVRGSFDNRTPVHYGRFVLNLSAGSNCIYQSSETIKRAPSGCKRQFSCRSSANGPVSRRRSISSHFIYDDIWRRTWRNTYPSLYFFLLFFSDVGAGGQLVHMSDWT